MRNARDTIRSRCLRPSDLSSITIIIIDQDDSCYRRSKRVNQHSFSLDSHTPTHSFTTHLSSRKECDTLEYYIQHTSLDETRRRRCRSSAALAARKEFRPRSKRSARSSASSPSPNPLRFLQQPQNQHDPLPRQTPPDPLRVRPARPVHDHLQPHQPQRRNEKHKHKTQTERAQYGGTIRGNLRHHPAHLYLEVVARARVRLKMLLHHRMSRE